MYRSRFAAPFCFVLAKLLCRQILYWNCWQTERKCQVQSWKKRSMTGAYPHARWGQLKAVLETGLWPRKTVLHGFAISESNTGTRQAWQRRQRFYRYLNVAALPSFLIPITAWWWKVTGHFSFTGGFWMNNTATNSTNLNTCPTVRRQIGKTTYIVRVHFSETAKETMEDKIKRLLREEVRKMWLLFEFDEKVLDFSSLAKLQNQSSFLAVRGLPPSILRNCAISCPTTN